VSPVFRHGRLRLYLLKLLDESPRHGYEVIRLLQDRFMGVYAPSPGTIYPRLARLEEDGLVTHEEVDGKKVYSITDKGREEIRNRLGDLADLEDELTESLRDVAREISEDVRDTVRSIREELTSAAREFRATQEAGKPGRGGPGQGDAGDQPSEGQSDEAHRIREEARRSREQMRASFRAQGRGRGDWAAWQERAAKSDSNWGSWTDWIGGPEDWFGTGKEGSGRAAGGKTDEASAGDATTGKAGQNATAGGAGDNATAGGTGQNATTAGAGDNATPGAAGDDATAGAAGSVNAGAGAGKRSRRGSQNPFSDLERMALQFATELRAAARQTGDIGERSLSDLRDILTDTLAKVRVEVFSDNGEDKAGDSAGPAGTDAPDSGPADGTGRS
jgi:DNA-binding PadR family transcriptional regulator